MKQIGDSTNADRLKPFNVSAVLPAASQVIDVACGKFHSCAVLRDGKVFCMGLNDYGQVRVLCFRIVFLRLRLLVWRWHKSR
jgi:alpha-tubulin suppressor-like RCC1 family protein